ncbi:MAG: S-adenosylmethionine decarboxylase [Chlamydiae bacterium]|nr:S-adenosylmethionine decarboxylase [Chlamydiota bacterium]
MSKKSIVVNDEEIVARYEKEKPWGMAVAVDLHGCDLNLMKDKHHIEKFLKELVPYIKMKAYGAPVIHHFGTDPRVAGFSAMQLIETSSITAHFANNSKAIYLDVFSCKWFKPNDVVEFCKKYFKAESAVLNSVVFRA